MLNFDKTIVLDRYTVMARVVPACIVALPLAEIVYSWAPFEFGWAKGSAAATIFAAGAYALSHVARDAGKRLEERLLAEWGGWPSTAVLRHSDTTFDEITKSRFHRRLVELGAVDAMPTPAEEAADPRKADAAYAAAGTWLRSKTRDAKKFPLVFEENINYGFVRNLLGSKWYGLGAAGLGVAADALAVWTGRSQGVVAGACVVFALLLLAGVTEAGLRRQAFAYARRLVESLDHLEPPKAGAKLQTRTKTRD